MDGRPGLAGDSARSGVFSTISVKCFCFLTGRPPASYDESVESTRTKILDILRRRREATIDDLTRALQLAPATVRRHLDILQRDGYVAVRAVRRATGRPHYAFSLTEAGEDLLPQHYVRMANRLIDEIVSLSAEETNGRTGQDLARLIFARMGERLARVYGPRVAGANLRERLDQAVAVLRDEGIVFEAMPDESGGFLLVGSGCPCRRVADRQRDLCSHDQLLLSRLLRAEVEPIESPANGDAYCAYRVSEAAASPPGQHGV